MLLRRVLVYSSVVAILFCAPLARADAIQDLLDALRPPGTVPTSAIFLLDASTTGARVVTSATATPVVAEDPQVIVALRQLIITLTQQLAGLVEATKTATHPPNGDKKEGVCKIERSLGRGMRGSDVSALQEFLIKSGDLDGGTVLGVFGSSTERAVQEWQAKNSVISAGTPSTTGYGFVGILTRTIMKVSCLPYVPHLASATTSAASNSLKEGEEPKSVRLTLEIGTSSSVRGDRIPVKVHVLDPIPYSGADIDFMQRTSRGTNTFGAKTYLPVGFSGEVTHYLNASHMSIAPKDVALGVSTVPVRAVVEARLHSPTGDKGAFEWRA